MILCSCQINAQNYQDLILKPVLKAEYTLPQFRESGDSIFYASHYFLVDINVINKGQSIREFIIHDCSATECLILDQDCVQVCFNNCGKNSVTLIRLKPDETYSVPIILQSKKDDCRVRIGFIPISPKIKKDYFDVLIDMHEHKKGIIWSDFIFLYPGCGQVYEIK